jgi:hypothetical protein
MVLNFEVDMNARRVENADGVAVLRRNLEKRVADLSKKKKLSEANKQELSFLQVKLELLDRSENGAVPTSVAGWLRTKMIDTEVLRRYDPKHEFVFANGVFSADQVLATCDNLLAEL